MHLRGKSFTYTAHYPDGRHEILLSVPNYDFNWQSVYRLAEPKPLPKGTTIQCEAHFDNSAANPANPDPTQTVLWGEQTWDEMMIGFIDYYEDQPIRAAFDLRSTARQYRLDEPANQLRYRLSTRRMANARSATVELCDRPIASQTSHAFC